jgi:hypothetical protein
MAASTSPGRRPRALLLAVALGSLAAACALTGQRSASAHLWWSGYGPVLPHDTFPADCRLCHEGGDWQTMRDDFVFDHGARTGVPLEGAHEWASCLRCHNDRGPVAVFQAQGCGGCHEDVHQGELGTDCTTCHQETSWFPVGQFARHYHTRFPLVGVHASTACRRCHPGAEVGNFLPADTECVTCHASDLAQADNPNHVGLGWVDNCDRCHIPTTWQQAEID